MECPFKVGDRVIFSLDEQATGWAPSTLKRARMKPGDAGMVTRIHLGQYLYVDDERGGFHWKCYEKA